MRELSGQLCCGWQIVDGPEFGPEKPAANRSFRPEKPAADQNLAPNRSFRPEKPAAKSGLDPIMHVHMYGTITRFSDETSMASNSTLSGTYVA